jgi:hypothetical protein
VEKTNVCVTVNYNVCKSARALCDLYVSVIKSACVSQLLINAIIRTRTRLISGVYHPTGHNIYTDAFYSVLYNIFYQDSIVK